MESINITAENSVDITGLNHLLIWHTPVKLYLVFCVTCVCPVSEGLCCLGEENGLAAEVHSGVRGRGWYRFS